MADENRISEIDELLERWAAEHEPLSFEEALTRTHTVLDRLEHQTMRYVAEHYDPNLYEEDPDHDIEEFWEQALENLYDRDSVMWVMAAASITFLGHVRNTELRLFEHPEPATPRMEMAWQTLAFIEEEEKDTDGEELAQRMVDFYLLNLRDGLMDATWAFHDLSDDDEDEEA